MRLQLPLSKGACTATQRNTAQANTYFPRALEQESCNHLSTFSASESRKNAPFGRFWVSKWDRFCGPELGPARPQKGSFSGSQKWAPMNAALLKGLGKPGARISKPGPKKWSPKTGPKIGPIIFAPQQQAVSKKSTRRNIYTKLLCARMALNSKLHEGFQIKT